MLPVLSQIEADLTACFVQDIAALLDSFSEKDTAGKQSLQQMLSADQAAFGRASIRVLAHGNGSAGSRYVLHLLRKHNLLVEALADPIGSKREDAIAAARVISHIGTPIDADLERALSTTLSLPPVAANAARVLRLLDLLEVASAQPRFYLFQQELFSYPDSEVRWRSTLLVACTGKSAALVGRMLLDNDVHVQANAVEALWSFDPEEAHPLLLNAARSKTPRVAGNALVGLYRIGDLSCVGMLFHMAQQDDLGARTVAAWAMGETGDPRFLPFLTSWFVRSIGDERVTILQALGRIRRHEKTLAEAGAIEIRTWEATAKGSSRHLVLSLWSASKPDLSALKPTDFALWEGGRLVQDYEISTHPNPALGIYGFILPRFTTETDPYHIATMDALDRCLKYKRADDLWRLDRYLIEPRIDAGPVLEKAALPYEDCALGALAKTHQRGFFASAEALRIIVESAGAKARAADDVIAAFDRQSETMTRFAGKRKLFLFLPPRYEGRLERQMARLTSFIADERFTLHGIAPEGADNCEAYQSLCLASEGGSFATLKSAQLPGEVERIYAQSINRFEVTYRVPERGEPAGALQITSHSGCGRTSFSIMGS